jgi:hypothetical protein
LSGRAVRARRPYRREPIFADDRDRRRFLETLGHYGPELRAADEAQAQKLVRAERRRRHWLERELARRRQGAAPKVAMAWRLRRETPMTLKGIAARLQRGAWTSLSNAWTQQRRKEQKCQ